jgi:acetyltransferase EpsM
MPEPLLILGARRFAIEVADIVSAIPQWELRGFVENIDPGRCLAPLDGLPVHWVDDLKRLADSHWAVCAFGSTTRRGFIEQARSEGIRFATLIHPLACLSPRSQAGPGSILWPGVVVGAESRIGEHVLVNRGALIGHHTELGDGITVGPGANIAGGCSVGPGCYIGMGALIVDSVQLGPGAVVAAGSVVSRDVPGHVMVAGNPAVIVRQGVDGR